MEEVIGLSFLPKACSLQPESYGLFMGGWKMAEEKVGVVTHYFGNIGVAAIKLTDGPLSVGDTIHIKGHTSDFNQKVGSMQIEHDEVETAKKGSEIGIKATEHAREHDEVFKVTD